MTKFAIAFCAVLCSAAPAKAWFCDPPEAPKPAAAPPAVDTPEAKEMLQSQIRSEAIFSEFKDNYFITGFGNVKEPEAYVRFQFSIKANLIPTRSNCTVFFVFTQKSLWNLWDWNGSSPIVDLNYNPGLFLAWRKEDRASSHVSRQAGWSLLGVYTGLEHESNGRDHLDSRSWNRITTFARISYHWSGATAVIQPSVWIPFGIRGSGPGGYDPDGGGNPDLLEYYGYGQLVLELATETSDPRPRARSKGLVIRDWALTGMLRPGSGFKHFVTEITLRKSLSFIPMLERTPLSAFLLCSIANGEVLLTYRDTRTTCRIGFGLEDRAPDSLISG